MLLSGFPIKTKSASANFTQPLEESLVAYGFTATGPAGDDWWVNCETGFLDQFRQNLTGE